MPELSERSREIIVLDEKGFSVNRVDREHEVARADFRHSGTANFGQKI